MRIYDIITNKRDKKELSKAIIEFGLRQRRYGK